MPNYSKVDFTQLSENELINFILFRYHQQIRGLFGVIGDLFSKPKEVFNISHSRFEKLKKSYERFQSCLEKHLHHEENIVFPFAIQMREILDAKKQGSYFGVSITVNSLRILEEEHQELNHQLNNIKLLSDYFHVDSHFNAHAALLYSSLKEFCNEFQYHFALEDEVLYPKLLTLENQLLQYSSGQSTYHFE